MATYTDVQFIGYALPTTPFVTEKIGFPSFIEGYYPGIMRALEAHLREQVAIALATAWLQANSNCPTAAASVFTAMNKFADLCNHDPLYKVTDTCYVVAGGSPDADYPDGLSVRKEFLSNEDFVLNLYGSVRTEEECAYPQFVEGPSGEDKQTAFDAYGIFTIKRIRFGIEICLDHYEARLRRNRRPESGAGLPVEE